MKKTTTICALALLAVLRSAGAFAGPFGDEMSKCIVRATTSEDRVMLVQWIFSVMALHPSVHQLATVPDETRANLNKRMADLMVSLLADRCAKESREAMKNEGPQTVQDSFALLGKVGLQDLFVDPAVKSGVEEFSKSLDEKKLKELVETGK